MSEGAWIFLSHSHQDFDKVAQVRNYLEEQRHHPLMFFLKCLNDDQEVDSLIRREIEARSWFVLCNTANSRSSKWVQSEVDVIHGLSEKTYSEIDLDDANLDLDSRLFALTHKASVFLSYSRHDIKIALQIRNTLKRYDFGVFSDLDILAGEDWQARIYEELESAARLGAIVVLVSFESVRSPFLQAELMHAARIAGTLRRRVHILPVYVDGISALSAAPPGLREQLFRIQGLDLSTGDYQAKMFELMRILREYEWQVD